MSRTLSSAWILLSCLALLATACQKKKEPGQIPAAFEICVAELASAKEFAETGLTDVPTEQVRTVFEERLDKVGTACQPVFAQATCGKAVANMKQALSGGASWMDLCREAFCTPERNEAACSDTNDSAALLEAIWTQDWGSKAGIAMRKRVQALDLDPKKLSARLMQQVDKRHAEPIKVQMPENQDMAFAGQPTRSMTVSLSDSGLLIQSTGIEPIKAKNMDALAEALVQTKSLIGSPRQVSVAVVASDSTSYQHVIDLMDKLIFAGFENISIGPHDSESDAPMMDEIDTSKEAIAETALVTLSKTTVSVDGKAVGEIAGGTQSWQPAMVAALKTGHPGESTLILQADKAVLYETLLAVIDGAKPAGFVDIVFAVHLK